MGEQTQPSSPELESPLSNEESVTATAAENIDSAEQTQSAAVVLTDNVTLNMLANEQTIRSASVDAVLRCTTEQYDSAEQSHH